MPTRIDVVKYKWTEPLAKVAATKMEPIVVLMTAKSQTHGRIAPRLSISGVRDHAREPRATCGVSTHESRLRREGLALAPPAERPSLCRGGGLPLGRLGSRLMIRLSRDTGGLPWGVVKGER